MAQAQYLDFENPKYQKGYKLFYASRENAKKNIGKKICFLLSRDYDRNRGYMRVRYGVIHSVRYSYIYIDGGNDNIDMRDILEAGIEIEVTPEQKELVAKAIGKIEVAKGIGKLTPKQKDCTEKMKLLPIFMWWFNNIGEKCVMRIGFRFDEYDRMERFFNNSDPTNFRIPISCKTYGERKQVKEDFNWRFCSFPLIKAGVDKEKVVKYWEQNGWVGGGLFEERRQIVFPPISNCIGCFHKSPEHLAAMAEITPDKFKWFIDQEVKGMGTWLDSRVTYQHLSDNRHEIYGELVYEMTKLNQSCDTGGCTD